MMTTIKQVWRHLKQQSRLHGINARIEHLRQEKAGIQHEIDKALSERARRMTPFSQTLSGHPYQWGGREA